MRASLSALLLMFSLSVVLSPADAAASRRKPSSTSSKKTGGKQGKATPSTGNKETAARKEVKAEGKEAAASASAVPAEEPAPGAEEKVDPQEFLKKSVPFQAGIRAMADYLPDVAIRHFQDLLAAHPPAAVVPFVNRQLGEAYIRNGRYDEGLRVLNETRETESLPGVSFWKAVAYKGKGQYSLALRTFDSLGAEDALTDHQKNSRLWQMAEIYYLLNDAAQSRDILLKVLEDSKSNMRQAARLAIAVMELQMGNLERANELSRDVVKEPRKYSPYVVAYSRLIQARILLQEGKPREARALLTALIDDSKDLPRIIPMAKMAAAQAEIAMEEQGGLKPDEEKGRGEDRLLAFIEAEPDSPLLGVAFDILRGADAFKDPEAYQKLQDWARGGQPQRTPYAMATLAREAIARDEAVTLIDLFGRARKQFPEHVASLDLQYLVLQYLYDHKKWDQAEKLVAQLPESAAKTLFMKAGLAYGQEKYDEAADLYSKAFGLMKESDRSWEQIAAYNEAIAAIQAQMGDTVDKILKEPDLTTETYSHILLERALESASRLEAGALESLKKFVEIYPQHPRLADAYLAMGELALYQETPLVGETLSALSALESMKLSSDDKERVARLRIILPEYMEQWPAAIQAARNYLDVYKDAELREPMQLKLGELLYRNNDFNQAHLYLQNMITRLSKDSPQRIPALFLSGKAAHRTDTQQSLNTALKLFEQVAREDSSYKAAAEIEAASILMRQGKAEDVIKRLDEFVLGGNLNDESRRLALALSAEAWASLGSTNPEALDKARKMTAQILESPDLPSAWRDRTLFQQARLSERAGDNTEALRDYHLITSVQPDSDQRRDWYWYYQAGFAAMHLLEEMKNWEGVIALAEYMANAGGPRSDEAAKRARKIRLEHFVWGDDIFADDWNMKEAKTPEDESSRESVVPESVESPVKTAPGSGKSN